MTDNKTENVENGQKQEEGGPPKLDPKTEAYLQELLKEKHILSTSAYPHASRLMQEGLYQISTSNCAAFVPLRLFQLNIGPFNRGSENAADRENDQGHSLRRRIPGETN